ncbi:MAG: hypothetical protein IT270_19140 [Saprospiraceae bacterium]|nr:hypothetical protein [Saprospiraceae bacterium]
MKYCLLVPVLLLLCKTTSLSQINPDTSFSTITAEWNVGEHKTYQGYFLEYKIFEQDTFEWSEMIFDVDVDVQSKTDSGYIIDWRFHNYLCLVKGDTTSSPAFYDTMRYLVRTTKFGAFQELVNWKNLSAPMSQPFREVLNDPDMNDSAKKFASIVMRSFEDRNIFEHLHIPGIRQFYTFLGKSLVVREGENIETIPHFLTGEPVDYTTELIELLRRNDQMSLEIISHKQAKVVPVSKDVRLFLWLGAQMNGKPFPDEQQLLLPSSLNETTLSIVDEKTGWVKHCLQHKHIETSGWIIMQQYSIDEK